MPVQAIDAAADVLDRAGALLAHSARVSDPGVNQDIHRSVVVMATTAIDTYFHWRVHTVDLNKNNLPKSLNKLDISFGELVTLGDNVVDARNQGKDSRPTVFAKNVLHRRILRETFSSPRGIEKAFALIGITQGWSQVANTLGEAPKDVKDRIGMLADKRNAIVHEGDIKQLQRPREIKHDGKLEHATVQHLLDWVRRFITAADSL